MARLSAEKLLNLDTICTKSKSFIAMQYFTSPARIIGRESKFGMCAGVDMNGAMLSSEKPRRLGRRSISSSLRTVILFKT